MKVNEFHVSEVNEFHVARAFAVWRLSDTLLGCLPGPQRLL